MRAFVIVMALAAAGLTSLEAAAQQTKRVFFNGAGNVQVVGRDIGTGTVFTDRHNRFQGAVRRTPSGSLIYGANRKIAVTVRRTPSGALIEDRATRVQTAIRRTPSGLVIVDENDIVRTGERDPFQAPRFASLDSFETPIGAGGGAPIITIESDTRVAAAGGLEVNLGAPTLDVVIADVDGAPRDVREIGELRGFGRGSGAGSICAGAGCERFGAGA